MSLARERLSLSIQISECRKLSSDTDNIIWDGTGGESMIGPVPFQIHFRANVNTGRPCFGRPRFEGLRYTTCHIILMHLAKIDESVLAVVLQATYPNLEELQLDRVCRCHAFSSLGRPSCTIRRISRRCRVSTSHLSSRVFQVVRDPIPRSGVQSLGALPLPSLRDDWIGVQSQTFPTSCAPCSLSSRGCPRSR